MADEVDLPLELIRAVGAIPSYYLRYYYATADVVAEQREGQTRAEAVMAIERELLELYRDPALAEKPALLERRGGAYYSEAAAQLIASLYDGAGDVQVVDVRNTGALPGVPDAAVVEVPAVIDRNWCAPGVPCAARPGAARPGGARPRLRGARRAGGDQRRSENCAPGAPGEPARAGLRDRPRASRRDFAGQPGPAAPVLPGLIWVTRSARRYVQIVGGRTQAPTDAASRHRSAHQS